MHPTANSAAFMRKTEGLMRCVLGGDPGVGLLALEPERN